jgi:hypothetical protein
MQPTRFLGGYESFGRPEGTVTVKGERFEITTTPISARATITGACATASAAAGT